MSTAVTETVQSMDEQVSAIHFRGNQCYVGNKNKLCIFDCTTLEHTEIVYGNFGSIIAISLSIDGTVAHMLHHTYQLVSVVLATRKIALMMPDVKSMVSGDADILYTCNRKRSVIDKWSTATGLYVSTLSGSIDSSNMLYFPHNHKLVACDENGYIQVRDVLNDTVTGIPTCHPVKHSQLVQVNDTLFAFVTVWEYVIVFDINSMEMTVRTSVDFERVAIVRSVIGVIDKRYVVVAKPNLTWVTVDTYTGIIASVYKDVDYAHLAAISDDGLVVAQDICGAFCRPMCKKRFAIKKLPVELTPPLIQGSLSVMDGHDYRSVSLFRASGLVIISRGLSFVITASTTASQRSTCSLRRSLDFVVTIDSTKCTRKRRWDESSNTIIFKAKSVQEAIDWVEAINAVSASKMLPPAGQALVNNSNIIRLHRMRAFDLLQLAKYRQHQRGLFGLAIPRDVVLLIGEYLLIN